MRAIMTGQVGMNKKQYIEDVASVLDDVFDVLLLVHADLSGHDRAHGRCSCKECLGPTGPRVYPRPPGGALHRTIFATGRAIHGRFRRSADASIPHPHSRGHTR